MGISKALNYDNPQHICRITPSNHLQTGVFETAKMGLDPTINPHVQNWAYLIISLLTLGIVNFGVYHTSRLKISQAPNTKDEIWARDMPALFPLFWVAPPTMVPTFMWSSFTSNDWTTGVRAQPPSPSFLEAKNNPKPDNLYFLFVESFVIFVFAHWSAQVSPKLVNSPKNWRESALLPSILQFSQSFYSGPKPSNPTHQPPL